ncbi:hypothetical protein N7495_008366 [Penicillium taxi]|uniref:uncharacterized protein n=1 Tax=Penicillium taxi TaxID=168475 RepID=UPI002545387C|nr:uncharacterized protein N7495_008366 [Penicillium taxi]KAJ5888325.1 hypothetical protein N7495_008366 [Penicillium taxi]
MRSSYLITFIPFVSFATASLFPRETSVAESVQPSVSVSVATATPAVTTAPALTCSAGSTVLYTTECTVGKPISYCHSPEPPIQCQSGYFPSVYHPGHCIEQSTCFPVDADWITTDCSNGAVPYSTSTLFEGTLAGGKSTTISVVSCTCSSDQWYSMTAVNSDSSVEVFCMPYTSCPSGMTTSTRTNEYCATATGTACDGIALETRYCQCENPKQTAVYPASLGAAPTGCA